MAPRNASAAAAGLMTPLLSGFGPHAALRAVWGLVAIKAALFCVLALNTRFVMDEFWHFAQANYLGAGFFETIFPEKAVGYAIFFKLGHWLGWDAQSKLAAARALSAALGLGLCALVYAMARRLGQDRLTAAAAVLGLLAFSTFMERGFRLRSEPLAILFAAAALWVCLGDARRGRTVFCAGALSGLAFVTTQKAAYFNLGLGVALVAAALTARAPGLALRRGAWLLAGWGAAVAVYALALGGAAPGPVLRALVLGPVEVALHGGDLYPDIRVFLLQTVQRNALAYALCAIGLALAAAGWRRMDQAGRIHLVFTLVVAGLVFAHDQPWPYVFTMALPFLAPYGALALARLAALPRGPLAALALGAAVLAPGFARNLAYLEHDNRAQLAVVRTGEALIPPGAGYFDGIGMIPTREMAPRVWLDAMGMEAALRGGPQSAAARIFATDPPEVVIESYRLARLGPVIGRVLSESYVRVADNIRVQGADIAPGQERTFRVLRGREFAATGSGPGGACAEAMVGGAWRAAPLRLEPGTYRLRSCGAGGAPVRLAPAEMAGRLPPGQPEWTPLFLDIYTF